MSEQMSEKVKQLIIDSQQYEDHFTYRLFQSLEQTVGGSDGEKLGAIDNEYFILTFKRRQADRVLQLFNLADANLSPVLFRSFAAQ